MRLIKKEEYSQMDFMMMHQFKTNNRVHTKKITRDQSRKREEYPLLDFMIIKPSELNHRIYAKYD